MTYSRDEVEASIKGLAAAFVEAERINKWSWIAEGLLNPKLKQEWVLPVKRRLIEMLGQGVPLGDASVTLSS